MASLVNYQTASDLASAALLYYEKGDALDQTTQDKPLLRFMSDHKKTFSGGLNQISVPVQGAYMSDTPGFLQGYSQDDALLFTQAQNLLRAVYTWKEVQMSLIITWTELKIDGITVTDSSKTSDHETITRLTGILKNRMADFAESKARALNLMFWQDGSQDAKQMQGLTKLMTDTPTTSVVGTLSPVTYSWWQPRFNLTIPVSGQNTSLIQFLNSELIQLKRYGGRPDKALCGSGFLDALRIELVAKGYFTQTGFGDKKATNLGINGLRIDGLGDFEYDPTMDALGYTKRCYIIDSRRITLRPMEQEDSKMLTPERPYNYLVFLKTITWTGAMQATQLNACAIYGVN